MAKEEHVSTLVQYWRISDEQASENRNQYAATEIIIIKKKSSEGFCLDFALPRAALRKLCCRRCPSVLILRVVLASSTLISWAALELHAGLICGILAYMVLLC